MGIHESWTHRNLWCGYDLNGEEQEILTKLTMWEFKKSVIDRREPEKLVEEAKNIHYFSEKWR